MEKKKNDYSKDSKGNLFPYPREGYIWVDKNEFVDRLELLNEYLDNKHKYEKYDKPRNCLLCDKKNITTKLYKYKDTMWEDGFIHYIIVHDIEPSIRFKKFIYNNELFKEIYKKTMIQKNIDPNTKMIIRKIQKENKTYAVIEKNQLLILDALLIHGGYEKKYHDPNNLNVKRYSEHAGLIDFEMSAPNYTVNKIIVSGITERVDVGDDEIFLPNNMDDMFDYEYIFHTHPPTPKPGGRVDIGILYEFPSIGDIFHFIDHYNDGYVIGSLVMAPEGLYNIRRKNNTKTKKNNNISINEDELFKKYQKIFWKVQNEAVDKYGNMFSEYIYYSKISQDTSYIDEINHVINTYDINIDYYPRRYDGKNKWYIDTVFLIFNKNNNKKN